MLVYENMIKKVITKYNLEDMNSIKDDLAYWLSKSPEERVSAVEIIRRQHHGSTERLQSIDFKR